MMVNSYPMSAKISRRAGDDDPSMIFKVRGRTIKNLNGAANFDEVF